MPYKDKNRQAQWLRDFRSANVEACRRWGRERTARLRREALVAYSGRHPFCACCKITFEPFLVIDHINGGGNKQRKEIGAGSKMYQWLKVKGYPTGFRVLCENCNRNAYRNGGTCDCPFGKSVCRSA